MKKRDRTNIERLGVIAAWTIAAAFLFSFAHGVRWPFPSHSDPQPVSQPRQALEPAHASPGRVEVLNGTPRSGLARTAMERLRAAGYDVVYIGNADPLEVVDSSVVLDRIGDLSIARAVAERLGILRVVAEPDSTAFVDATVLLGLDWEYGKD